MIKITSLNVDKYKDIILQDKSVINYSLSDLMFQIENDWEINIELDSCLNIIGLIIYKYINDSIYIDQIIIRSNFSNVYIFFKKFISQNFTISAIRYGENKKYNFRDVKKLLMSFDKKYKNTSNTKMEKNNNIFINLENIEPYIRKRNYKNFNLYIGTEFDKKYYKYKGNYFLKSNFDISKIYEIIYEPKVIDILYIKYFDESLNMNLLAIYTNGNTILYKNDNSIIVNDNVLEVLHNIDIKNYTLLSGTRFNYDYFNDDLFEFPYFLSSCLDNIIVKNNKIIDPTFTFFTNNKYNVLVSLYLYITKYKQTYDKFEYYKQKYNLKQIIFEKMISVYTKECHVYKGLNDDQKIDYLKNKYEQS